LAVTFLLHWSLPVRARKPLLVAASYAFYCSWSYKFGFLLLAVSVFSWAYGLWLERVEGAGRWLVLGIAIELLPLLFFKYTNFFLQNVSAVSRAVGLPWQARWIELTLPLGVSFFTFQGIAYLVDVSAGEQPFRKIGDFLLFKGFWPQLIAGPIIRPDEIREQITEPRTLDYDEMSEGVRRIVSGLLKKVALADTIGAIVDPVFLKGARPGMVDTVVAVLGFGMQIYWDFSAYSEIAIGSARVFGFRFPENFDWPYSSRSPQEFWNRWHMTLSRWIRDYVFTPLAFAARRRPATGPIWLLVAMGLCGLWHGAAWTFVLWGLWHGLLLVLNQTLLKPLFSGLESGPRRTGARGLLALVVTLVGVNLGWLLFRAQSVRQAVDMLGTVVTLKGRLRPILLRENDVLIVAIFYAGLLIAPSVRSVIARADRALAERPVVRSMIAAAWFTLAILGIVVFDREARAFVYFQF
jgi:alginate O-acetyltransferase complex protein AlgI